MPRKLFKYLRKLDKLSEPRKHNNCYSFFYIGFDKSSYLVSFCYLRTSSLSRGIVVTREPRAYDSEAKGPKEYWWEAPSIGSIGGDQGSYGGNPRAKGNTGIKGLLRMLGMIRKGV